MIGRTVAAAVLIAAFASLAGAQTLTQKEIVLTVDPQQQVTLNAFLQVLKPAVRIGDSIYLGVVAMTESIFTDDCFQFYFLQADDLIPDDAQEFVSVVVGAGNSRGYLWRGAMLHSGPCIGAGPKIPG